MSKSRSRTSGFFLRGRPYTEVEADLVVRAAFERFLEIASEASRKLPADWKDSFGPSLNWRGIADLGNRLRHAYHMTSLPILWSIYANDLDPLEAAIDAMIAAHAPRS